jgi:predicted nucleic acid-binding protein
MIEAVIDTNLIIASLKNQKSRARDMITSGDFKLYSPNFIIAELFNHKESILNKSKINLEDMMEVFLKILGYIEFVNEQSIQISNYVKGFELCKDIDRKDTPFVSLSIDLGIPLWTRYEELKRGLIKKGWDNFLDEKSYY